VGIVGAYYKLKEHLRIYRFRLKEEVKRHRIFFELLNKRWKSLFALVALVLISFIADFAFASWILPAITTQSWYNALEAFIGFPSNDAIIGLLSAIISGIAAVIGLLLTISLVVLELAANRYPYRMVRFLVEEKVGAYIIDFLIVSFLFSAWTLFLLQRGTIIPIISILVSLLMASLSIVFVFVYRGYSLYFFRPKQGFEAVALEACKSINNVLENGKNLGLSVTTYLQKRTQGSIQVMTDFIDILSQKKDPDSWYGNRNLASILSLYITGKRFIDM
jgi:hypothetical protein